GLLEHRIRSRSSLLLPDAPRPPPFPYTTLFRSSAYRTLRGGVFDGDDGVGARAAGQFGDEFVVDALLEHRPGQRRVDADPALLRDRKSTRLNSSHVKNSYAVLCLKKKESITATI